jgi:hypothetical protein
MAVSRRTPAKTASAPAVPATKTATIPVIPATSVPVTATAQPSVRSAPATAATSVPVTKTASAPATVKVYVRPGAYSELSLVEVNPMHVVEVGTDSGSKYVIALSVLTRFNLAAGKAVNITLGCRKEWGQYDFTAATGNGQVVNMTIKVGEVWTYTRASGREKATGKVKTVTVLG